MFKQITILGPGLLGASLLQAAKRRGLCQRTAAWSRRAETRAKCEGQPWCDAVFADAGKAVAKADLVVVCTPVDTIVPLLGEIAPKLKNRRAGHGCRLDQEPDLPARPRRTAEKSRLRRLAPDGGVGESAASNTPTPSCLRAAPVLSRRWWTRRRRTWTA